MQPVGTMPQRGILEGIFFIKYLFLLLRIVFCIEINKKISVTTYLLINIMRGREKV